MIRGIILMLLPTILISLKAKKNKHYKHNWKASNESDLFFNVCLYLMTYAIKNTLKLII